MATDETITPDDILGDPVLAALEEWLLDPRIKNDRTTRLMLEAARARRVDALECALTGEDSGIALAGERLDKEAHSIVTRKAPNVHDWRDGSGRRPIAKSRRERRAAKLALRKYIQEHLDRAPPTTPKAALAGARQLCRYAERIGLRAPAPPPTQAELIGHLADEARSGAPVTLEGIAPLVLIATTGVTPTEAKRTARDRSKAKRTARDRSKAKRAARDRSKSKA